MLNEILKDLRLRRRRVSQAIFNATDAFMPITREGGRPVWDQNKFENLSPEVSMLVGKYQGICEIIERVQDDLTQMRN